MEQTPGVRRRGEGRRRRHGARRCSRSPAPTGSGSSRSPRASATWTRGSTAARATRPRARHFTGFHRIEKATCGRPVTSPPSGPVADQLLADVAGSWRWPTDARAEPRCSWPTGRKACSTRSPAARSPARRTGTRTPTCGTSRANLEGSQAAVQALRPVLEEADPDLVAALDARVRRDRGRAGPVPRSGDGWMLHDQLTQEQLKGLSDAHQRARRAGQQGARRSSPSVSRRASSGAVDGQALPPATSSAAAGAGTAGVRRRRRGRAAGRSADDAGSRRRPRPRVPDAAVPFHGEHQAGIVTPAQDRLHFVAFDVITDDRDAPGRAAAGLDRRPPGG